MSEPAKILVIDDDSDVHQLCALSCPATGFKVLTAYSSREGKDVMESEPVDLVILDVMMEEADSGFEMARWLAEKFPKVPVLLLSSIVEASALNFDTSTLKVAEMVNKPIHPQRLRELVARLLGRNP